MAKCYFELRKQAVRGTDSIAADIMRHLHTRQHIGKAVVICDQPVSLLAVSRKQWLKLGRALQKQRASTLNADKILKFTHTITHMQHMRFTRLTPLDDPEADVYFLDPETCVTMPDRCYTIYCAITLDTQTASAILGQLPAEALVVDYDHRTPWGKLGLRSKLVLEEQVASEWRQVRQFLTGRGVLVPSLVHGGNQNVDAMDDALDTLLAASNQFLRIANDFQRALELARPIRVSRQAREEYDAVVLLAYRVQALSPGIFTQRFLQSYNEDDTYFFYDAGKRRFISSGEPLAEAIVRQTAAGRTHLAHALRLVFNGGAPASDRLVFEV